MICHRDFQKIWKMKKNFPRIQLSFNFNTSIVIIYIYTTISKFPQLSFLCLSNINTHHSILAAISTQYVFEKKKMSNEKPSNGVPVLVKILKRNGVTEFSREKERKVLNITFNIVPSIPITRQSHAIIFSDRLGSNRPQPIFEMEINQRQGISDSHVVAINKLSMLETGSDSGSRVGLLLRRNE